MEFPKSDISMWKDSSIAAESSTGMAIDPQSSSGALRNRGLPSNSVNDIRNWLDNTMDYERPPKLRYRSQTLGDAPRGRVWGNAPSTDRSYLYSEIGTELSMRGGSNFGGDISGQYRGRRRLSESAIDNANKVREEMVKGIAQKIHGGRKDGKDGKDGKDDGKVKITWMDNLGKILAKDPKFTGAAQARPNQQKFRTLKQDNQVPLETSQINGVPQRSDIYSRKFLRKNGSFTNYQGNPRWNSIYS